MKLAVAYSNNEVETLGLSKSQNFGFSKDAEEMIFTMFTKNIYSNPIGSVVREITSNCFDSHKEASVDEPVIVRLTNENGEYYISFVDVGVGMSPERISKVYAQYFNSTKRSDNNQIGGFGIGGKTPLAYAESFFLITVFNGVKYTYCIRKGTKSPVLDLLGKTKTTEHNGTTIKIPVRANDVHVFEREINRQLYYFENVIFEGFSQTVKNEYTIVEGKNFLFRGSDYSGYVHICLGRVAYPIDFSVLEDENGEFDSNNWRIPVAIKMDIGEINVTVSREAIDYTGETKKLIKKKLLAVKEELLGMLAKQHENISTLEEYYLVDENTYSILLGKDRQINVSSIADKYEVSFSKLDSIKIPSQAELIHLFYDSSMFGKKGRRDRTWDKSIKGVENHNVYLLEDDEQTIRKKNTYMKHMFKHFFTLKKIDLNPLQINLIIDKITPSNYSGSLDVIEKQFKILQHEAIKLVEKKVKKYSSVDVPENFKLSSGKTYDPNYEIPVTYHSYRNSLNKERIKMKNLENFKGTIYYCDLNDELMMLWAFDLYRELFKPKANPMFKIHNYDENAFPVRFIMVAKNNIKYVSELKNAKPLTEFNKMLMRKRDLVIKLVEKKMFFERYDALNDLFLNVHLFKKIDKEYTKILNNLKKIKNKYDELKSVNLNLHSGSNLLSILSIDLGKISPKGEDLLNKVEEITKKNKMLTHIKINSNFDPDFTHHSKEEINDIFKLISLIYVK